MKLLIRNHIIAGLAWLAISATLLCTLGCGTTPALLGAAPTSTNGTIAVDLENLNALYSQQATQVTVEIRYGNNVLGESTSFDFDAGTDEATVESQKTYDPRYYYMLKVYVKDTSGNVLGFFSPVVTVRAQQTTHAICGQAPDAVRLTAYSLSPKNITQTVGTQINYSATATYSDGSQGSASDTPGTWSVDNTSRASINSKTGVLQTISAGAVVPKIQLNNVQDTGTLDVTP